MSVTIETMSDEMLANLKAFRTATVAADGKATPFARSILASLVSGARSKETVTAAVLHAFGNPKSEAGKPIKSMSGGAHIKGFPAVRETVKTVFRIFENIGVEGVKPLVVAFILNEGDAKDKRINWLATMVKQAIDAAAAAEGGDNEDAKGDNEEGEGQPKGEAPVSLADRINALNVAISASPEAVLDEATDAALAALMDTIKLAYAVAMEDGDAVVQELEEAA